MSSLEGIGYLTERIAEIERARDALALKVHRLEQLQRAFVEISAATDERGVAIAALRGAWLGLDFGRAFWFACGDGGDAGELNALYELDGEGIVESEYGGTLPVQSSLRRVARGDSDAAIGTGSDSDSPLFDVLRWYVAAKVRPRTGSSFIIYADGVVDRSPDPWALASLREVADQAALTLGSLRMADELERLALHDPLTGLPNRRALGERVAIELASARRTGEPVASAILDVDDFTKINDSRGHAGGDAALQAIARAMRLGDARNRFPRALRGRRIRTGYAAHAARRRSCRHRASRRRAANRRSSLFGRRRVYGRQGDGAGVIRGCGCRCIRREDERQERLPFELAA